MAMRMVCCDMPMVCCDMACCEVWMVCSDSMCFAAKCIKIIYMNLYYSHRTVAKVSLVFLLQELPALRYTARNTSAVGFPQCSCTTSQAAKLPKIRTPLDKNSS